MVLAFTGLGWEEAVAVPIENVDLEGQWIKVPDGERVGRQA